MLQEGVKGGGGTEGDQRRGDVAPKRMVAAAGEPQRRGNDQRKDQQGENVQVKDNYDFDFMAEGKKHALLKRDDEYFL